MLGLSYPSQIFYLKQFAILLQLSGNFLQFPIYLPIIVEVMNENEQVQQTEEAQLPQEEQTMEGPAELQFMYVEYQDQNGQKFWTMHEYYISYFTSLIQMINTLRATQNQKWTAEEQQKYQLFLNDLGIYITNEIFKGNVHYFNYFTNAMLFYGENTNPIGFQLYNDQLDYLAKKQSGYDFKLEKKKQKKTEPKEEVKKQKPIEKPKEEEVIRKDDPTITAQELKQKTWPEDRYTDLSSFHKENANLIFIGHVDSGKSTLTGNIMKQLKLVDEQQLQRNKQEAKQNHMESWELAFIADSDPNQRKRGKTVECSKMMFTLDDRRFTLFDAPGHKNYVPNMMMGACQSDIAVLIISAKDGEFESGFEKDGQTKQHAMLATALGVKSMIAVVTKMSTVQWSQARFNHIREQVAPYLAASCGFKNVQFIPIDSINNSNIHTSLKDSWYTGPCLLEVLNKVEIPIRDPDGPLRIPIVDKYKEVGQFFVYGKLESGKIAYENQVVSILPKRSYLTIKQIFNARDQRLPYALAGQNVKLRVKGIEEHEIHRGDVICNNTNYCQQSMEFKANLTVLELPEQKKLVSSGFECVIHMHAIEEEAEISLVEARIEPNTRKVVKASYLKSGEMGKIVIKLQNSVCMEKFEFMESLGRFTLRDQGKTIGFGEVTKIKPAKNLTKQQKDQLGIKTEAEQAEEKKLTAQMQKVEISN